MTDPAATELAYRIPWRSSGIRTGAHVSRLGGASGLFKEHVPLLDEPDPRRLDIRASFQDPFQRLLVRRAQRPASIVVYVLIDASASMACAGRCNKLGIAARIAAALASSAHRAGDSFGLIVFNSDVVSDASIHASRSLSAQLQAISRVPVVVAARGGTGGLVKARGLMPRSRCLAFLISDLLWSPQDAELAADALTGHDVVPLIIDDSADIDDLPDWGLGYLKDSESGTRRLLLMRPSLKRRWREQAAERRRTVLRALSRVSRPPLTITDAIDWQKFAAYLMHGSPT